MSYTELLEEINKLSVVKRLALIEDVSRTLREELGQPLKEVTGLSPDQLRSLPLEERQRTLAESARLALPDYQPGGELTEFTYGLAGEDIYNLTEFTEQK